MAVTRTGEIRILRHGVVAGLLGAVTVALWFLAFDASRGHLLETPALLGAVLLHGAGGTELPPVTWELVLEYSVLHVVAFLVVGVVAAALIVAAERETGLIVALLLFFGGFEVFFVALVMFHGPTLTAALSWWAVLAGNLLATGVMLAYFFLRHRALGRPLLGPWARVAREGVVAGLVGAATVAVWFLVYDTAMGRPLYTPALLGAAILKGLRDPAELHVSMAVVLGYSVLHGTAFVLFGLLAAALLAASEREPMLLLAVFVVFTCFEVFFFGVVMVVDEALVRSLGWWTILVGNLLAATAMFAYLRPRHGSLGARLRVDWAAGHHAAAAGSTHERK
jgi:hypothetical protein